MEGPTERFYPYANEAEYGQSVALAKARQQLAHEGSKWQPAWGGLTECDRDSAVLMACGYLRAAKRAGLIIPEGEPEKTEQQEGCEDPDCGRIECLHLGTCWEDVLWGDVGKS